uniref:DOMON domain-containing protein n=1 Tax=Minutocellus polymorphus TaxID=265543 RepID=A0A7S0FQK1_9STRA|mmetsp:Transcript_4458/g.7614  ORF Transcript_4458/g.7614 Transcript_4458/m.7614 type:complete len:305 (+) Transcript_4458:90-1004(+)
MSYLRALLVFVSASAVFPTETSTFAAANTSTNVANANADMPPSTTGVTGQAQRRSAVDCTEYQHTFEMPFSGGSVVMDYVISDDTLRARLTRQGTGWVGLAVPEDPNCMLCMKNSDAVIGVPGGSVLKYDLAAYKVDGVVAMEESRQTLEETSVVEIDGTTTVTFVKKLEEEGENAINGNGPNTFLWAMGPEGFRGELAYHTLKGKFQLDLTPCDIATTTSSETESPTVVVPTMPVSAPTSTSEATVSNGITDSPTISVDNISDATAGGGDPVTSAAGTTTGVLSITAMATAMLALLLFSMSFM